MSLAESIKEYYEADPQREDRLQQVLTKQAGFSLRDIDWFVTNMSARKPQIFKNTKNGRIVDVNSDYKDVLRCYHKSRFDSFKRKCTVVKAKDRNLKQRNFFRWALENGIVDKVSENIQEIKDDMVEMKQKKDPTKKRQKKKTCSTFTIVQQPKELKIPMFTNIVW